MSNDAPEDAPMHLMDKRHPRAIVCGLPLFAHDTADPERVTCQVCIAIHAGQVVLVAGRQAEHVALTRAEAATLARLVTAVDEPCPCHAIWRDGDKSMATGKGKHDLRCAVGIALAALPAGLGATLRKAGRTR